LYSEIINGPADLARAQIQAKKAGILTSITESAPPNNENAASLYERWYANQKAIDDRTPFYAVPLRLKYKYTPAQIALIQKLVEEGSANDRLLTQAAWEKYLYLPPGPRSVSKYGQQLRSAARSLCTKSTLLALKGKYADAINLQRTGLLLVRHCEQQPGELAYMVSLAIQSVIDDELSEILCSSPPSEQNSQAVEQIASSGLALCSFKSAVQQEPALQHEDFLRICRDMNTGPVTDQQKGIYTEADKGFITGLYDAVAAREYGNATEALQSFNDPRPLREKVYMKFHNASDSFGMTFGGNEPDPITIFADSLDFEQLARKDDKLAARTAVLIAGAQVLAIKAKTGSYPATLPAGSVDPFTGKPLVYSQTATGFVLFSVGPPPDLPSLFDWFFPPAKDRRIQFTYPAPPLPAVPANELRTYGGA